MINRIFSSFDPVTKTNLNYVVVFISLIFLPSIYFILKTRNTKVFKKPILIIYKETRFTLNNNNKKGKTTRIITLFLYLFILNILGLIPYVFRITAHIRTNLRLCLPFWLGFILFAVKQNPNKFFIHLVPTNTPTTLSQFMVIIELIRQIIRPLTLSVRLTANITAGHILIILSTKTIILFRWSRLILFLVLVLEIAVAIIQRYVFTTLTAIYINETYDKPITPVSYSFFKPLTFNGGNM